MTTFSDRLRSAIESSGLTKSAVASAMGVHPPALSRWLRGSTPDSPRLQSLATTLNVNVQWLLTGEGPMNASVKEAGAPYVFTPTNVHGRSIPLRWVPVVSWAHAGEAASYEELPPHWRDDSAPTECRDPKAFALVVDGDSMEPRCLNGDIVVVMPSEEPRSGCLVVAKLRDDGVVLRRYSHLSGGRIRLTAYNSLYPATDHDRAEFHWIYPVESTVRKEWS